PQGGAYGKPRSGIGSKHKLGGTTVSELTLTQRVSVPPPPREEVPTWEWNNADRLPAVLEGEVVSVKEREGQYGPYPIVTLEDRYGGKIVFHAASKEARDQIRNLDP